MTWWSWALLGWCCFVPVAALAREIWGDITNQDETP